ncbi:MAG: IS66 family insertion sequence element accessory protein TnpB [Nitrosomonas sp.]|nr:IS66 family insertion sequence element accessory protein TnpB [Nitrosomonas sp.]MCW5607565.1 IS66 family insertion sequence element accessory protein TnpB [Nitrosomonas sp.]
MVVDSVDMRRGIGLSMIVEQVLGYSPYAGAGSFFVFCNFARNRIYESHPRSISYCLA